jgi:hypothetical protein
MAALLVLGGLLMAPSHDAEPPETVVLAQPGTAVGDLQSLDKNHDLLANFDLLDDLSANEPQGANP